MVADEWTLELSASRNVYCGVLYGAGKEQGIVWSAKEDRGCASTPASYEMTLFSQSLASVAKPVLLGTR